MEPGSLGNAMLYIRSNPAQHDQRVWFCRTTACLAGRIALQAGADECPLHYDTEPPCVVTVDGRHLSVQELAEESAGLTRPEGQHLFHPGISLDELCHDTERIIADLAIECDTRGMMATHHHSWHDTNGNPVVSAHRRTVFIWEPGNYDYADYVTRAQAYDYASDLATARLLTYRANPEPPEGPK